MVASSKIVFITLVLVFIAVIGGAAIMSGQYFDNSTVQQDLSLLQKEPQTFNENKRVAISITEKAIDEYVFTGTLDSLDASFLTEKFYNGNSRYAFVLDYDNQTILVHPNSDRVGTKSFALNNSEEPLDKILHTLKTTDSMWVHYDLVNPDDGKIEPKMSFLKLEDGYIFGSGFYIPDIILIDDHDDYEDDYDSDYDDDSENDSDDNLKDDYKDES